MTRESPRYYRLRKRNSWNDAPTPARPGVFIAQLLTRLASPIELNDLVEIAAEFWGIRDRAGAGLDEVSG